MNVDKIEEILAREEFEVAPIWKRVLAYLIDDLLISMVLIGIYWDTIMQNVNDPEALIYVTSSSWFILYVIRVAYQAIFVKMYGATIGKMVVKIRIIEVELLDNPSWKQSFLRSLLRALSEFLMYLPFFFVFTNTIYQSLHDRISKTLVINFR